MIRQAIGRGGVSCRMQSQRVAIPKMMRAKTRCSSFVNHQHESIKTVLPGNASAMSTNVDVVRIPGYLTGNGLEYKVRKHVMIMLLTIFFEFNIIHVVFGFTRKI